MVKKSSDGKCLFYEKSHKYKVKGDVYTSVTTLIGSLFPKFDEKGMARKLASFGWAKKQKKGVRYWLNEWKKNRNQGTLVHTETEKLILSPEDYDVLKPVLHPLTIKIWEVMKDKLDGMVCKPELLIYDNDFKVAGQVDLVVEEPDGITIYDWKVTKSIDWKYKYNEPGEDKGVSEFTNDLPNTNGYKYSLQLSTYAYLLEKQGYKVKGLYLGHVSPVSKEFSLIKLTYYTDRVKDILNNWRSKNEEEQ